MNNQQLTISEIWICLGSISNWNSCLDP